MRMQDHPLYPAFIEKFSKDGSQPAYFEEFWSYFLAGHSIPHMLDPNAPMLERMTNVPPKEMRKPRLRDLLSSIRGKPGDTVPLKEMLEMLESLKGVAVPPPNPDDFRRKRTKAEVLELQTKYASAGGCCDRFADNSACDCLSLARTGYTL